MYTGFWFLLLISLLQDLLPPQDALDCRYWGGRYKYVIMYILNACKFVLYTQVIICCGGVIKTADTTVSVIVYHHPSKYVQIYSFAHTQIDSLAIYFILYKDNCCTFVHIFVNLSIKKGSCKRVMIRKLTIEAFKRHVSLVVS